MLPGLSGTEVCRELRSRSSVPIIMLTAKDSEVDIVVGLELGADDYVTKPYSSRELLARIRAVLRRRVEAPEDELDALLEAGPVRMDVERHAVTVDGREVAMPLKEFELLELLLRNAGRVLTRGQLIDRVWGSDYFGDTKTLDVHIKRIRSKIEHDPSEPQLLVTVRGLGYRFEALAAASPADARRRRLGRVGRASAVGVGVGVGSESLVLARTTSSSTGMLQRPSGSSSYWTVDVEQSARLDAEVVEVDAAPPSPKPKSVRAFAVGDQLDRRASSPSVCHCSVKSMSDDGVVDGRAEQAAGVAVLGDHEHVAQLDVADGGVDAVARVVAARWSPRGVTKLQPASPRASMPLRAMAATARALTGPSRR